MDDDRPPRGKDKPPSNDHDEHQVPLLEGNLERPVTAAHLENLLNDFQTKMEEVVQKQIKNNMLFFLGESRA